MPAPAYLHECADRAASVLGHPLETSITIEHRGVHVRAASATAAAARCDQAEARGAEGPCVDAMARLTGAVVPDLTTETRWRSWCELALDEGFRSVLAMPAFVSSETTLALNLYSREEDPWTKQLATAADGYAQLAASLVRLRLELSTPLSPTAGLFALLQDDQLVSIVVDTLMIANGCSEEEARAVLSSASQHRNVEPRAVSEVLLTALMDVPAADRSGTGGLLRQ